MIAFDNRGVGASVDLLGFSLGGALTFRHPEYYLFFTRTSNGRRAARDFLRRLKERKENRDTPVSIPTSSLN